MCVSRLQCHTEYVPVVRAVRGLVCRVQVLPVSLLGLQVEGWMLWAHSGSMCQKRVPLRGSFEGWASRRVT